MKRIAICCLVLVFLAALASGYQVHEEPEEIPVTTLEVVSSLIKNRQQQSSPSTTPQSSQRRADVQSDDQSADADRRRRDEYKHRIEAQREQQRRWQEQLNRRRMEQLIQHNRRMQEQIAAEDKRSRHGFYRDPFGFNALTKWVAQSSHGPFNGHAGHGDGHVYQHYNREKPLHFGGQPRQGFEHPVSTTKATAALDSGVSTTASTPSSSGSPSTSTVPTISNPATASHHYEVNENIDEGINPFTWPNWFGIINVLTSSTGQQSSSSSPTPTSKPESKIAAKKSKVALDDPALQNKIAPKDNDQFKAKYYEARKNKIPEEELTGNEIDGDVLGSGERLDEKTRLLFSGN